MEKGVVDLIGNIREINRNSMVLQRAKDEGIPA